MLYMIIIITKMKKYLKKYKFIRKINDKSILKCRESISKYD